MSSLIRTTASPVMGHIGRLRSMLAMSAVGFAGLVFAIWGLPVASGVAAETTVQVQTDQVYYELPRWSVGAKFTGYGSGCARADSKDGARTTPDGKNWIRCIKEMKLGFIGASMYSQGQPPNKGKPQRGYDDWRLAANAVVESGGGVMIEYMAGVGPPPGMPLGTTAKPELADNIDTANWGVQNCVDWADYMASLHGRDKIFLFEFYNEPACMRDSPDGANPNGIYWYSYKNFKNPDDLARDWALNHQQDYYKAVKPKYPDALLCGASYAAPAESYSGGDADRWMQGYPGARISATNPNTKYQDALSLHCYGYHSDELVKNAAPGAASGVVQAIFNSIFYPTLKDPGNVSGYKVGVDQWVARAKSLPGGENSQLVDTEWWVYSPEGVGDWFPAGGVEGSHQAVADVLGWIVHCQNADRWRFRAIQYHMANVVDSRTPDAKGRPTQFRPQDGLFCGFGGKIWRTGRYFAIKDICARFANDYPSLVKCSIQGPPSPQGPRNNSPGTQIQCCGALNKDKTALAVCLANIGDGTQSIEVALGRRAAGPAHGVVVPTSMDVETPLTKVSPSFSDDSKEKVSLSLPGYTAALIEIPLER